MGSASGGGGGTPPPTANERALAEVGAKDYNFYKEVYSPLTKSFINDVRTTEGEKAQAEGVAATDVAQGLQSTGQTAAARGFARGMGAGSSRTALALADTSIDSGTASGRARSGAVLDAENNELRGLRKVASFGRGLSDDARLSLTGSARRSAREAIGEAFSKERQRQDLLDVAGAGAGLGLGYLREPNKKKESPNG